MKRIQKGIFEAAQKNLNTLVFNIDENKISKKKKNAKYRENNEKEEKKEIKENELDEDIVLDEEFELEEYSIEDKVEL